MQFFLAASKDLGRRPTQFCRGLKLLLAAEWPVRVPNIAGNSRFHAARACWPVERIEPPQRCMHSAILSHPRDSRMWADSRNPLHVELCKENLPSDRQ